jgi:hypothetical protein
VDEPVALAAVATVESDPAIDRLAEAIALGEGFQLHILVCDSPRAAGAALETLHRRLRSALPRLAPDLAERDLREGVSLDRLASSILGPLTLVEEVAESEPPAVVIDASNAVDADEPAWRQLFRRMNERRNAIVRRLPRSLLLCLPPSLEVAFAHEAPDFWSIRSSSITVMAPQAELALPPISAETEPVRDGRELQLGERERRERGVVEARRRLEQAPGAPSALHALVVQLSRLGLHEEEWGTLDRAQQAHEESLAVVRRLLERDPERPDWLRDLSVSLERSGTCRVLVERWTARWRPTRSRWRSCGGCWSGTPDGRSGCGTLP